VSTLNHEYYTPCSNGTFMLLVLTNWAVPSSEAVNCYHDKQQHMLGMMNVPQILQRPHDNIKLAGRYHMAHKEVKIYAAFINGTTI